ncbi:MAG: 4-vinyl reductase [Anaerolineae bacterium]|nr:4-vinyl reductase [Anaerolineae bacterium]
MSSSTQFSPRLMKSFVEMLSQEVGRDTYHSVLSKSDLSRDWRLPEFFLTMDGIRAAEAYANLQSALRTYYGRGARGTLLRIGTKLWEPVLSGASLAVKTQAAIVRGLPKSLKRKPVLEVFAGILGTSRGDITVHTLDLDLLLVDQTSPTTLGQKDDSPICFVTLGMIRECLYWATGEEHDIEERACRAMGAHQCEFKITIGA